MGRKRDASDDDSDGVGRSGQRLDKWLWFARIVRTRVTAAELAESGHVRVNGQRAASASRAVRSGDVLTIAIDRRVLVLKVIDSAERRGEYSTARLLYEDLTTAPGETTTPEPFGLRR